MVPHLAWTIYRNDGILKGEIMAQKNTTYKMIPSMRTLSFISSLIGGVLILVNGVMSFMMLTFYGSNFSWMWGMMDGYQGMMGSMGFPFGSFMGLMLVALVCGILVIIGAVMLNARPNEHRFMGHYNNCFFRNQLFGNGRISDRCNTWHIRWSFSSELKISY
jgi:hypothetical protein